MARGWESKSVEEQHSMASQRAEGNRAPANAARTHLRRGLELQISQLEQQLAAAHNEQHRNALRQALADRREKLAES
ncbi:MAG: hypothetical protein NVS9B15_21920 [Acidobacteriaceae bacterium]